MIKSGNQPRSGEMKVKGLSNEDQIMKNRFLTQMSVPKGPAPLKILTKKILLLAESVDKGVNDVSQFYRDVLREISQALSLSKKFDLIIESNKFEQLKYKQKQKALEQSITIVENEICLKKNELKKTKEWRAEQEEYETLRDQVLEHPSKPSIEELIRIEENKILSLKIEEERVCEMEEKRRKQYHLLFTILDELRRTSDVDMDRPLEEHPLDFLREQIEDMEDEEMVDEGDRVLPTQEIVDDGNPLLNTAEAITGEGEREEGGGEEDEKQSETVEIKLNVDVDSNMNTETNEDVEMQVERAKDIVVVE